MDRHDIQGAVWHAEQRALQERGSVDSGHGRRVPGRRRRRLREGVVGQAEVRGRGRRHALGGQKEQVQRLSRQARRRHR